MITEEAARIRNCWKDSYFQEETEFGNKIFKRALKRWNATRLKKQEIIDAGLKPYDKEEAEIYVYDLLKADNSNWLPKQFKHRKGQTNEKEL